MPNFIYTKDIPDAANNPSNDQAPMEVNTNSIFDLIRVDHHGFNDNLGGYHTIIHQDANWLILLLFPGLPKLINYILNLLLQMQLAPSQILNYFQELL